MTTASREAFLKLVNSGERETDKIRIFNLIKEKPRTIESLKAILKKDKSSFSSRISELCDMGLIEEIHGGKLTLYRHVWEKHKQNELQKARHHYKAVQWFMTGQKAGYLDHLGIKIEA